MLLLVDYREKWFVNALSKSTEIDEEKAIRQAKINDFVIDYQVANLEVGDFVIKDSLTNTVYLVIERKTMKDLSASITDGRFRQQKERLLESTGDCNKILYMLEGNKVINSEIGVSKNAIHGSIVNLLFKHNYKVLHTSDESSSLSYLVLLYKKYKNGDFINPSVVRSAPIELRQKMVSKTDKVKQNILALQLCVIPGVSFKTAEKISEKYKSMVDLCEAYKCQKGLEEKKLMLADITISDKRKVGKALSCKIYNLINNC